MNPTENSKDSFPSASMSGTLDSIEGLHQVVERVTLDEIVAAAAQVQKLIQHLSALQTTLANLAAAKRLLSSTKETLSAESGKFEPVKESPIPEGRAQANSFPQDTPQQSALSLEENRPAVAARAPEAKMNPIISSGNEQSSIARRDDFMLRGKRPGEEKSDLGLSLADRGAEEKKSSSVKDLNPGISLPPMESFPVASSSKEAREPTKLPIGSKAGVATVPLEFFDRMINKLTEFVGPMARVMIHDQVGDLGESMAAFPQPRLGELVELVSREIPDNKSKVSFQQQMSNEIRTFKLS